ncbi:gp52 topoisomerase II medium subunit [Delftia phage PhiW-14]|uniref:DNA topoisomerase (ATP-hydrolyzing) n=1 Tax=Delftia phage PhiW-14 TaxID=665032 RepID=C9DGJ0_BPW14|nr:gp52 topoisomerase II medium subunit [Delftia phage PhiW-14]ACV50241.1 gp52 topoisomerase II medium subunit [Delftia phage PhiW-14]
MKEISISQHIQGDHKAYATYDNQRNIPHIADGLKPSLRKIIHTAIETMRGKEEVKVAALGSRASDLTEYGHGEDSIIDAVVTLGRNYRGTNNLPLLQKQGQFGTMVDNDASEPRYIHVSRHANLSHCFKEEDRAILDFQVSEGKTIEPVFFLPPLPLVLINASSGVGNGYSSKILPRSPQALIEMSKAILNETPINPEWSLPHFPGFKGRVKATGPCSYEIHGAIQLNPKAKTEFTIIDLPPDSKYQYEQFKERELLPLLDSKTIKNFESDSTEQAWSIKVQSTREFAQHPELVKRMGMILRVTENLTVWTWDGQLKRYPTAEALLRDWLVGREYYMEKRRQSEIARSTKEMNWLLVKVEFLKWWNANHNQAVRMSNDEIKSSFTSTLGDLKFDDEMLSKLLALPVSSLKMSGIEALQNAHDEVESYVRFMESTTAKAMIITDMEEYKF